MAQFTVRVELHDAKWDDYNNLHAAMEKVGFSRLITGDNGVTYHLPWAEYSGSGNMTSAQVRDLAAKAAASTGKLHAVLVSEWTSRAWVGLKVA